RGTLQDTGTTHIGSHNLFMAYSHVAHDCVIGDHVIMANGASLAGHVHLGDHVILGGFTLVHQFCKVGQYSFSAMGCAITRDVPPYVLMGGQPTGPRGINAVGLEREGFDTEIIRDIRKAYKVLYKSGLMLDEAIDILNEMSEERTELACMVDFLNASKRGILR
ncbi:MAG: acyl-[acyl-carrier-protein]--UDP-N-acetylglucosamine O-acyltransferase, partial [Methylococcales bacterium]|nr:acyl-[acyl-carrier-protein]--UDP-N-acetylglucosamine O-acyltransferase [Methylococcales bacterium]